MTSFKKILVVDDMGVRFGLFQEFFAPYFKLIWCSTFDEAVKEFADKPKGYYSFVFLDHDLESIGTGLDFARMFQANLNRKQTVIHSMNLSGGAEMAKILPDALHVPFDELIPILVRIVKDRSLFKEVF